jgi:MHS family alpha-ketoglutarate permease-like MFS transporter
MGVYADHKGRKAGLTLSVSLMCLGSLMIAVAPTHAQAGILSPAILLLARVTQGLSLGGEYGSSATYMSEIADRERRGFWSSFLYVTIIGGQLCALALLVFLQAVLGEEAMHSWGWRIGFIAGAVLAIVVFFIRRRLDETVSYENVAAQADRRKSSIGNLFRDHPARSPAGDRHHRRRNGVVLRLHHLPAEVPRQHQRVRQGDRVAADDGGAGDHAAAAASRRPAVRSRWKADR